MLSPWYSLMTNVAVVAFFVSVWTQARDVFERFGPRTVQVCFGLVMGLGAVTAMLFPVEFSPGVIFDLRVALVALAAFFGGPLAGLVAGVLAGSYRVWIGGIGTGSGLFAISLIVLTGAVANVALTRNQLPFARWHSVALALATCTIVLLAFSFLPHEVRVREEPIVTIGRTLLLFVAVLFSGLALTRVEERRSTRLENRLFRQVVDALPDSVSVRDLDGRFVTANSATARLLGVSSPDDLIGRRRDEFVPETPAPGSHPVPNGDAVQLQQVLKHEDGTETWLQTRVTPLNDDYGHAIGTISHEHDITARRRLETELDERQRVLSFAMAQMSDGVAMFDRNGRLLYCNAQYQQLFPRTSDLRIPGAHIRAILAGVVARREQQVGASASEVAKWIDDIVASLRRDSEEEVHLFNGTWLRVSTRPSPDGVSMVVVSDITRLKRTEIELLNVTEQLRQEATTDPLTGLMNRRALDQRLEIEIARSLRTDAPLTAILLDIDHFKAYNDTYGHLAGDECLRVVSNCLTQVFQRPADLVARYGGEEFLVVLPDTDADAAYQLAVEYRGTLKGMAMPHKASPLGHVTVSVGIAGYAPGETARSAEELVGRADEALYEAKTAGRDRVSSWRRRFPVIPRTLRIVN